MKKKTTIYDIAQALNITVSTVSRALNGFPAISESTRKAVVEMAKTLHYSPNKLASALKSGKTYTVGIIVPSVQAHFFASIIHFIEDGLKDSGFRVIIYQSNESVDSEMNGVKALLEAQVDGIMASLSLETNQVHHFKEVMRQHKPLILFDRVSDELQVPKITLDDFRAGYLATCHLVKQGYRKIALLTTRHQIKAFKERLKGYQQALADHGLPINADYIILGDLSVEDGQAGAEKLMKLHDRPDAILAGDDFTALGVSQQLKKMGLAPPEIGVIGFADESFSAYVTPGLSTIDQHPDQIGKACAKMFLDMITGINQDSCAPNVIIQPTIVERPSTKKIPDQIQTRDLID